MSLTKRNLTYACVLASAALFATACAELGSVEPEVTDPGVDPDTDNPGEDPDPDPVPDEPDVDATGRILSGLQALYRFDEGAGAIVNDVSGVGAPLTLTADDPNAIAWLLGGGLSVVQPTILASDGPATKIGNACAASNAMTVEAWARTKSVVQEGPARVATYSDGNLARNFTLAQDLAKTDVRLRTDDANNDEQASTLSELDGFAGLVQHVVYTRPGGAVQGQIYVDGKLGGTTEAPGTFANWDLTYSFAVANEIGNQRPWLGELYLVAVYCRGLSATEVAGNYAAGY